jgi:hypothetical protein
MPKDGATNILLCQMSRCEMAARRAFNYSHARCGAGARSGRRAPSSLKGTPISEEAGAAVRPLKEPAVRALTRMRFRVQVVAIAPYRAHHDVPSRATPGPEDHAFTGRRLMLQCSGIGLVVHVPGSFISVGCSGEYDLSNQTSCDGVAVGSSNPFQGPRRCRLRSIS